MYNIVPKKKRTSTSKARASYAKFATKALPPTSNKPSKRPDYNNNVQAQANGVAYNDNGNASSYIAITPKQSRSIHDQHQTMSERQYVQKNPQPVVPKPQLQYNIVPKHNGTPKEAVVAKRKLSNNRVK